MVQIWKLEVYERLGLRGEEAKQEGHWDSSIAQTVQKRFGMRKKIFINGLNCVLYSLLLPDLFWHKVVVLNDGLRAPSSRFCVPVQKLLVVHSTQLYWFTFTTGCRPFLDRIQYLCLSLICRCSKNVTPTKNRGFAEFKKSFCH